MNYKEKIESVLIEHEVECGDELISDLCALVDDAYDDGYDAGEADGYGSGYDSGYIDGEAEAEWE